MRWNAGLKVNQRYSTTTTLALAGGASALALLLAGLAKHGAGAFQYAMLWQAGFFIGGLVICITVSRWRGNQRS